MVLSMTGFGRAQNTAEQKQDNIAMSGVEITVEVRSVNHRYFEFGCKTRGGLGFLEERLRGVVKDKLHRGKVDLYLSMSGNFQKTDVNVNEQLARSYVTALRELSTELGIADDLSVSALTRLPDLFAFNQSTPQEDELWAVVEPVVNEAVEKLCDMRRSEGERLRADLEERLLSVVSLTEQVEQHYPEILERHRARLLEKMKSVLEDRDVDEQRLMTEVALFADRTAVDEELVRLGSHVRQFSEFMESDEAIGRRLDFLIQEMNREVNTIGSKVQDVNVSKLVLELKAQLEKIREQVQNIE